MIVLLKLDMPVTLDDTVSVRVAAIEAPALRADPPLFQDMVM